MDRIFTVEFQFGREETFWRWIGIHETTGEQIRAEEQQALIEESQTKLDEVQKSQNLVKNGENEQTELVCPS